MLVSLGIVTPAASADGQACQMIATTPNNFHDGWESSQANPAGFTFEGSNAQIAAPNDPTLCDAGPGYFNPSVLYSMLSGYNGTHPGWVQTGLGRQANGGGNYPTTPGTCSYYFAQFVQNADVQAPTTDFEVSRGCVSGNHTYWNQFYTGTGADYSHERMNVDLTKIGATPWSIYASWNVLPYDVSWSGETRFSGTTLPGTFASPSRYHVLQVQDGTTDAWTYGIPTVFRNTICWPSGRYGKTTIAGNAFRVWDNGGASTTGTCNR
jgi:hypothetical protein